MAELSPRKRTAPQPAPEEPPIGHVQAESPSNETPPAGTQPGSELKIPEDLQVPHGTSFSVMKTLRMTDEHSNLLAELKFRTGTTIQEAVWYALEQAYSKK